MRHARIWIMTIATVMVMIGTLRGQEKMESAWPWIAPLVTTRAEIEKKFGESISKDKTHPFQTYETEFFKANIAYAKGTEKPLGAKFCLAPGTVISAFISPWNMLLSDLDVDVSKFRKDATYAPREISYFNEKDKTLISTTLVESRPGQTREMIVAIRYQPTLILVDTKSNTR